MMIKPLSIAAAAFALAAAGSASAETSQIVSRDAQGRASEVRVNGQDYPVCNAHLKDECINPRAAGLKWGNRAIAYWPGKPASEMKAS